MKKQSITLQMKKWKKKGMNKKGMNKKGQLGTMSVQLNPICILKVGQTKWTASYLVFHRPFPSCTKVLAISFFLNRSFYRS
jgi:hypothetical protein